METNRRRFLAALFGAAAVPTLRIDAHADSLPDPISPARLASDPRRPQYHFLPAANWMNDPNGPVYWGGNYHMFYQYNPKSATWGVMHWGHAVSPDLVHWRHLPVALAPTPGGPDADGCFTGTAAIQDGRVTILYTGVRAAPLDQATIKDANPPLRETQCLAVALDPDLKTWQKAPDPVIAAPPPNLQVNGFRDPSPWRQGDWWYTVTASGIANQGGAVLLYRSRDLRNWEYMHILVSRDRSGPSAFDSFDPWEVWECPEFFALGDRHVLIFSTGGKTWWQSGKLDEKTMSFHAEQAGILDYGSFYAAKTQLDKAGNRIVWGWISESRSTADCVAAGWAGVMSLPRILTTGGDGRIGIRVAPEVNQLRGREVRLNLTADDDANRQQIAGLHIDACRGEILCVARRMDEPFELILPDGDKKDATPWLRLGYDPLHRNEVLVDGRPLPLTLGDDQALELHLYIDSSVVEVIVNGQTASTKRFYPSGNEPQALRVAWSGKTASLVRFSAWQLSPISTNRLTT